MSIVLSVRKYDNQYPYLLHVTQLKTVLPYLLTSQTRTRRREIQPRIMTV